MEIQRNTNKVRHPIHTISSSLAVYHLVHEHLVTAPKYPNNQQRDSQFLPLPDYPDPPSLLLHVAYLETTACSSQPNSGTLADHVLSSHVNQPAAINIHGHSLASLFLFYWRPVVLQCPLDPKTSSGSQDGPGLVACAPCPDKSPSTVLPCGQCQRSGSSTSKIDCAVYICHTPPMVNLVRDSD